MTKLGTFAGGPSILPPTPGRGRYPTRYDSLGPVNPRLEDYVEAYPAGHPDQPWGFGGLAPLGWNKGKPDGSRMVGWTLRPKGKSQIVAAHAFSINPQAIVRTDSSRNQMFATQAAFYVDDFGPGSVQIQLTQLVAHGRNGATMRESVLAFYDNIYIAATANPAKYDVYFYDSHLWQAVNGKVPERVYFPPQGFQLVRSVSQHNTWQVMLMMGTLVAPPSAAKDTPQVAGQPKVKVHVVRKGETLKKVGAQLAGRGATHQRVLQLEQQVIALTAKYGADDIRKARDVPVYNTQGQQIGHVHVARNHLAPGEKIVLPAG